MNIKKNLILLLCFVAVCTVLPAQDNPTITVLDFQMTNVSENSMRSIITFLSASLFDTGLYRVIDTAQRETILKELEFSLSGCSDEACQLEVGQLLSAEIIVVGDIANLGNRVILTAKMVETETSETISTSKAVYQNMEELIDSMDVFAGILAGIVEEKYQAADAAISVKNDRIPVKPIAKWATLAVGAVATGVGGYFIYDALAYKADTVDPALAEYNDTEIADFSGLTPEEYYNDKYDAYIEVQNIFKGNALTGLLVSGMGVVSLGVAAALFVSPEKTGDADVSFVFLPMSDRCSFQWKVRL